VSTLVMTVTDKRRHRHPAHLGASPGSIMGIFVAGRRSGVIGTGGLLLGLGSR
jgi:ABC-type lipoprotein release transport system permease subunit